MAFGLLGAADTLISVLPVNPPDALLGGFIPFVKGGLRLQATGLNVTCI